MYHFFKRILDIVIVLIALLLLSPLLIPVIILLLLTGEHQVFYLQKRIGYQGKPFNILKFATMLKNSPQIGTGEITLRNDPRVTVIGKLLRRTKINELPQILNVLKGEMSIVGPRPLMEVSYNLYTPGQQNQVLLSIKLAKIGNMKTFKEYLQEKHCWKGYIKRGMKKKGDKKV
jgi:lipopolysaccharide/colanic/teichoic acid biosynthesis glycosyltransferase